MHADSDWRQLESVLSQDMASLQDYLQIWRLKLSKSKTVSAVFHLNNREANRELKVQLEGLPLPFHAVPTYIGVKLDRALTYRQHL